MPQDVNPGAKVGYVIQRASARHRVYLDYPHPWHSGPYSCRGTLSPSRRPDFCDKAPCCTSTNHAWLDFEEGPEAE